jgi:hypothetical protein
MPTWEVLAGFAKENYQYLGTLAQWVAAFATLSIAVVLFFRDRRRRWIDLELEMEKETNETGLTAQRTVFRDTIRKQRDETGQVSLESLLRHAGGLPPGLRPRRSREVRFWPALFATKLSPEATALWQWASDVYPSDRKKTGPDQVLHEARGALARHWDRWGAVLPRRVLKRRCGWAYDELRMLCWLELALACRLQPSHDVGKTGLFRATCLTTLSTVGCLQYYRQSWVGNGRLPSTPKPS